MSISRLHHTEEEKRLTYVSSLLQAYPVFVSSRASFFFVSFVLPNEVYPSS